MDFSARLIAIQKQIRNDFKGRIRYVGRYLEQQKVAQPSIVYPALLLDLDNIYFERKRDSEYQITGYLMVRLMTTQGMGNAIDGNFGGVALLDDVVDWFASNRTKVDFVEYFKPHSLSKYHENWGFATNSRNGGNLALRGVDIWMLKVAVSWRARLELDLDNPSPSACIGVAEIGKSFVVGGVGLDGGSASVFDAANLAYGRLIDEGLNIENLSVNEEKGSFSITANVKSN